MYSYFCTVNDQRTQALHILISYKTIVYNYIISSTLFLKFNFLFNNSNGKRLCQRSDAYIPLFLTPPQQTKFFVVLITTPKLRHIHCFDYFGFDKENKITRHHLAKMTFISQQNSFRNSFYIFHKSHIISRNINGGVAQMHNKVLKI